MRASKSKGESDLQCYLRFSNFKWLEITWRVCLKCKLLSLLPEILTQQVRVEAGHYVSAFLTSIFASAGVGRLFGHKMWVATLLWAAGPLTQSFLHGFWPKSLMRQEWNTRCPSQNTGIQAGLWWPITLKRKLSSQLPLPFGPPGNWPTCPLFPGNFINILPLEDYKETNFHFPSPHISSCL